MFYSNFQRSANSREENSFSKQIDCFRSPPSEITLRSTRFHTLSNMSNSRGGFFSLNRLLGKKHKNEKNCMYWDNIRLYLLSLWKYCYLTFFYTLSASNSLSKSSFQTLTRSTTNLEEISPQNKIVPLVAVSNAPFEQLFRITVYLPLGQLYVARIGAKTKLSELLHTICVDKSLDSNKFEFKHPSKYSTCVEANSYQITVMFNWAETNLSNSLCSGWYTSIRFELHSRWSRFEWNKIDAKK